MSLRNGECSKIHCNNTLKNYTGNIRRLYNTCTMCDGFKKFKLLTNILIKLPAPVYQIGARDGFSYRKFKK